MTMIDETLPVPEPVDRRPPIFVGNPSLHDLTESVAGPVEARTPKLWWIAFLFAGSLLLLFVGSTGYLFAKGLGLWGLRSPVFWGWDIVNFVFWVGIGHAGTLISALLFLFRQQWRTSISRMAEAMTIFAVMCALLFPTIHVGRIWLLQWLFPVPNQMGIWPQFYSPLLWDVFAVNIYGIVSLLFFYIGLVPDLATLRDRATSPVRRVAYGFLALGWRGSGRHWHHHEAAYLVLAGLATALVFVVSGIVAFDFASSPMPGWHSTIFPPYFVIVAVYSGFATVLALAIGARRIFGLGHLITLRHLDNLAKITLASGLIVAYIYGVEIFTAWYSANPHEWFVLVNRARGEYAWAFWTMMICNAGLVQLFWLRRFRTDPRLALPVALAVVLGMWCERFLIVMSLAKDFLPASWGTFRPTVFDGAALAGSFGLFLTLFLLFLRFVPMVALAEVKSVAPAALPEVHHG